MSLVGDLTRDFSRREFRCRCGCGLADPHPQLVAGCQQLRELVGVPVTVNSGSRCRAHNDKPAHLGGAGGERNSKHLPQPGHGHTLAADLVAGVPLLRLYEAAKAVPQFAAGGIGVYLDAGGERVHVDVRTGGPARWGYLWGKRVPLADVLAAAAAT